MNINKTVFVKSVASQRDFPKDLKKQILFAGKSNVGKSSTINALVGRKNFARVSAKPGKTVFVNLFDVDKSFWLVDLPGYGFSLTSEAERQRYSKLIDDYFADQSCKVARLYIIVDARHEPTNNDCNMVTYARECNLPMTIIANKIDKLKPSQIQPSIDLIRETLELTEEDLIIPFSAEKGTNKGLIIEDIKRAVTE
ncbi:MAG: YihA family ribosome biogenesis GTP-binding protein [Clostridia bacterium]|nr:YihA family ribosome biogenesis GTP-binding protein [Clostridia bacterium]